VCEDETHIPEVGTWESFGIPKILKFDCKGQNISHWDVLYIIGMLLKLRCRKWPHMGHLDICSTSYGKKKGRKSNWQFDSRALKVNPTPVRAGQVRSTIGKLSRRATVCFRTHLNRRSEQRVMTSQSLGSPNRDSFRTPS